MGTIARSYNLSFPAERLFDEVYFPVYAQDFLHHILSFDVHPPFGKFLLAIGIWLFGDNPLGWRFIPAISGIGIVGISGLWWSKWQKDLVGGVVIMTLLAIEPILITYSRVGLLDEMLLLLIVSAFCIATYKRLTQPSLAVVATLIGLAIATKWLAVLVVVPIGYVTWRHNTLKKFCLSLVWSAVVYLIVVLSGQLIGHVAHPITGLIQWHEQAWRYQVTLQETHPWSSKWWTWPLELRSVLLYYSYSDNLVRTVIVLGNPLLLWSSTLAVLGSIGYLVRRRMLGQSIIGHPLVPLLLGYGAFWLPWVLVHRVLFLYHYLPSYWFALAITVYWLSHWWQKHPWIVTGLVILFITSGLYFLPLAIGSPLSVTWLAHHVWINSWLY